jgi:hypothetical protein
MPTFRARSVSAVVAAGFVLVAAVGPGCAGAPKMPALPDSVPAPDPRVATCLSVVDRSALCAEQFVPMLVDIRVNQDNPKGIAEADATEGRDALVAKARAEWEKDSIDPQRTQMCNAHAPKTSTEDNAAWAVCLAEADCGAYVACARPLYEKMLTAGH